MKKLRFLFASLLLVFGNIYAQTTSRSGGSADYKVLVDDPDNLMPVIIGINPLVADVWSTNSYMGIGAFLNINVLKYGSITIDWKKAYFDGVKGTMAIQNSNTGKKIKNHRGIEFGLAYNLLSFKRQKKMQVVLSSSLTFSQTRRTSYTSYIMVPGTAKRMLQLRGGMTRLKTAMDSYDFNSKSFLFNNDTSIVVKAFTAQMQLNYLYAGISWHTVNNLVLQIGDQGLSTNCNDYNFFFDLFFMPSAISFPTINFSNVFGANTFPGGKQKDAVMTLNDNSVLRKTGWRLGWEATKNNIKGAFTYRVEFGVRPGLMNSKKGLLSATSYMLLSAGFTFPKGKRFGVN